MPDPRIPTEDEIAKLPRWAIVAFAARCARLVLPIVMESRLSQKDKNAVERAVTMAEEFASNPRSTGGLRHDAAAIYADVASADDDAAKAAYASSAASSAAAAAKAAARAADTTDAAANKAATKADVAANANAAASAAASVKRVQVKIKKDLELLLALSVKQGWDDNSPVPPSVFGQETNRLMEKLKALLAPDRLNFDLWIDPGNASKETLRNVLVALSELHMAAGGTGLEFKPDGDFVMVRELEPA